MSRHPRIVLPGVPLHIIQRGNNRNACFFCKADYQADLSLLASFSRSCACPIHAYVLMTNHVHVLVTPEDVDGPASMMKAVGERYVRYLNERCGRSGTLWDGRYRSCLIDDDTYLFICHRYIELNPVRAGMVRDPSLYRWSSHRCNAYADPDPIISPHKLVAALGDDTFARVHAYRQLFDRTDRSEEIAQVRDATNYNYACGSVQFHEKMADALGRQVARIHQRGASL